MKTVPARITDRFVFRAVTSVMAAVGALAASPAHAESIASPNGVVQCTIETADGQLQLSATLEGAAALEASPIRVILDGRSLTENCRLGAVQRSGVDERYPWRGVHSTAVNRCNAATFPVESTDGQPLFTLEVRVFDDGIAFRHVIPAADGVASRVPDEATSFTLIPGATVWRHDLEGHYETVHRASTVEKLEQGEWLAPPVTFQLPGGAGYGSITEAALANYSGMALRADGERKLTLALGHDHPASYPFRLRYENDVERLKEPASVTGEIVAPWRVIVLARDLNALVNSDIVPNLCPPPDAALFPNGMHTAWVKPGRALWRYLDGGDNTLEEVINFSRWAGELGFEYQVVEGFWSRWDEDEIRQAVEASREHGVGLWFWRHSRELRTPEARREFFANLKRWGVVGAKIDFFDHEHKEVVDQYQALLAEAARHQIMVNFHGANKPTGEARTWPNEITREGVKGMEARRLADRARHDATLPFTRYLAGPGDYTPVVFGERRGDTTAAHQIATAAAFNQPLLTYGAYPTKLLEHPAIEMIKSIPAVWDETVVLSDSAIGELALMARRQGDAWFLVAVNGPAARTITVPASFLGDGAYDASYVRDSGGEPTKVRLEQATVQKGDTLEIALDAGGGFIGRFRQSADRD